jgi:hypothetical protein
LNKDGCFYRVVQVSGEDIESLRITLNGSGGGNSTTTGPGGNYSLTTDLKNYVFSSTAEEMNINFTAKYNGDEENYISYIGFSLDKSIEDGAAPFYELDTSLSVYDMNKEYPIDLINYINLFDSGAKTVYLNVEDAYGNSRSTKLTIKLVELSLK